jgi:hypothetical protein
MHQIPKELSIGESKILYLNVNYRIRNSLFCGNRWRKEKENNQEVNDSIFNLEETMNEEMQKRMVENL